MNKFLLIFLVVLTLSCQSSKNLKLTGYYDILFSDAWQIALASLTKKGNILSNNQDKGEIIIKIHQTSIHVKIKQVTPSTIQYIVDSYKKNRSAVELVRAILSNNFEQFEQPSY